MRGTWEDPPESAERERKWDATFDELKQNPERWAKLFVGKDRNAHSLGGRLRKLYPDYEIMTRTVKKKKNVKQAGVWARWNEGEDITDEISSEALEAIQESLDDLEAGRTVVALSTEEFAEQLTEMTDGDPYGHDTPNRGGGASVDG